MISDYESLKAKIQKWLEQDDVTEEAETFIQLFEAEFNRETRVQQMIQVDGPTTFSGASVAVPDDYVEMFIWYVVRSKEVPLEPVAPAYFHASEARATGVNPPLIYVREGDDFLVAPNPGESEQYVMAYYKRLPALSAQNPVNWLLQEEPDMYLYGALSHAEGFVMNDARVKLWDTRYQRARKALRGRDSRSRFSPVARMRQSGGHPEGVKYG